MQLFYNEALHKDSTDLIFDKIESRHIVKVLRKKEGDIVFITNGKNILFEAAITDANDKKCYVTIQKVTQQKTIRNYSISIAIAPTKNNTRYEWFLEKATEIGVDKIFPIKCEHSERKVIKYERMDKVLQTAMKQSLQYKLPVLQELISLKELIALQSNLKNTSKFIAKCDFTNQEHTSFQSKIKKSSNVLILIGPEGGFSDNEIKLALENSFIPVSLGANRLRTETAGIVALHTVSLVNQD